MKRALKVVILVLIGLIGGMGGSIKQADSTSKKS